MWYHVLHVLEWSVNLWHAIHRIVYCLTCPCNLSYIGSTKHPVKCRILEHARAVANQDVTYPVARHFAQYNTSNRDLLRFYCLDHVPMHERGGNCELRLRILESRLIIDLQTKVPLGLNVEEELSIHIGRSWIPRDRFGDLFICLFFCVRMRKLVLRRIKMKLKNFWCS